jgi:hypothetical protein
VLVLNDPHSRPIASLFFVLWMLLGNFILLDLFLAVLVGCFKLNPSNQGGLGFNPNLKP